MKKVIKKTLAKKPLRKAQDGEQVKKEFKTPYGGNIQKSKQFIIEEKPINEFITTDNPNKIVDKGILKTRYNANRGRTVEKKNVTRSVSGPDVGDSGNFAKIKTRTVKDNAGQVIKEKKKIKIKGTYAGSNKLAYQKKGGIVQSKKK